MVWKVFDENYVLTDSEFPLYVNGKAYFEFFPLDAFMPIEETENVLKKVKFLSSSKGIYTYYEGELNVNEIQKGVFNIQYKFCYEST
ncbi:MAG: hypothetical protein Q4G27_02420 [Flavobacteriaceae bacterium]|nr:hypothetical protein [Flavobacteriaceae bacterium]